MYTYALAHFLVDVGTEPDIGKVALIQGQRLFNIHLPLGSDADGAFVIRYRSSIVRTSSNPQFQVEGGADGPSSDTLLSGCVSSGIAPTDREKHNAGMVRHWRWRVLSAILS